MIDITIAKTTKTPSVNFNFDDKLLEISGVSIPEDADSFYNPLLDWVSEYVEYLLSQPMEERNTTFIVKLIYFNTSTSDYLVSILKNLKLLSENATEKQEHTDEIENEEPSESTPDLDIDSNDITVQIPQEILEGENQTEEIEDTEIKFTHPLLVKWYYEKDDEDMKETGSHFESIIEIPFIYEATEEIV